MWVEYTTYSKARGMRVCLVGTPANQQGVPATIFIALAAVWRDVDLSLEEVQE